MEHYSNENKVKKSICWRKSIFKNIKIRIYKGANMIPKYIDDHVGSQKCGWWLTLHHCVVRGVSFAQTTLLIRKNPTPPTIPRKIFLPRMGSRGHFSKKFSDFGQKWRNFKLLYRIENFPNPPNYIYCFMWSTPHKQKLALFYINTL